MDTFTIAVVLRATERIVVVAVGGLAIYLGYRLFLSMPERDRSSGKFELPGGTSIFLTRIGPGAFFALFGTVVIALSFHFGILVSEPAVSVRGQKEVSPGMTAQVRQYSGITPTSLESKSLQTDTERANVLLVIRDLNRGYNLLRSDLSINERIDIERAIVEAKVRLLASVWDHDTWGEITLFREWVRGGEIIPAPAAIAIPVEQFLAGSPKALRSAK
ncbi:MAG: hypothetical protein GY928_12275 [Colwellia sp.]|nr:hypothetical protein [Colwellia sp.]